MTTLTIRINPHLANKRVTRGKTMVHDTIWRKSRPKKIIIRLMTMQRSRMAIMAPTLRWVTGIRRYLKKTLTLRWVIGIRPYLKKTPTLRWVIGIMCHLLTCHLRECRIGMIIVAATTTHISITTDSLIIHTATIIVIRTTPRLTLMALEFLL